MAFVLIILSSSLYPFGGYQSYSTFSARNFFLTADKTMKGSVKEPNISIYFFFPAHRSVVFYFRCSNYWWRLHPALQNLQL